MNQPRIIDMAKTKGWGNDIFWFKWETRSLSGHMTPLPEVGDILTCPMQSGIVAKFKIVQVEGCREPRDMFFAGAIDLPPDFELPKK